MATLAETRSDLRAHLDESQPAYFDDAILDVWIWEAARDIARRCETLQATRSVTISAGQDTYDIPEDCLRIHRVEYRRSDGTSYALEPRPDISSLDDVWWGDRQSQGIPVAYTLWGTPGVAGSQLYVIPAPSESRADGLRLWYYRLPRRPLKDGEEVEIPAGWQDLAVLYAEMTALRRAGSRRYTEAAELYEARLDEMMKVTRHWSDAPNMISGRDLYPSWLGAPWGW